MANEQVIELEAVKLTFMEGDVVHARFKSGHTATEEQVREMFATMERQRNGRKALFMVSFDPGAGLTNEARKLASSEESNRYNAADAIILRDFAHQLSANAFVRHNKPPRPIQLFPDQEAALAWLTTQHHLLDT
jgi:hypothetical protein